MKLALFFISLTFLFVSIEPDTKNFKIVNQKLVWQKVFESELTKEQILNEIRKSGNFINITENKDVLTAEMTNQSIDFNEYGISKMSAPIYLSSSYLKGFVLIEFKEGRYRVNIKNIKLIQKQSDVLSEAGELTNIETYALRKNKSEFKDNFLKNSSEVIDLTFEKLTGFSQKDSEDKW